MNSISSSGNVESTALMGIDSAKQLSKTLDKTGHKLYTKTVSGDQDQAKQEHIAYEERIMKTIPWVTALCMLLVMLLTGCFIMGRHATKREELGRSEKMRVLVDKVLMRANGWVMSEDIVRQIAEAGFNVVSPRLGGDDMERVRQVSEFAEKYGIYHMPWMRGTLTATEGTKLVWADGTEQDLYSPNSDELWEWMTRVIVNYAKISTEVPSLIGVFLDYENYAPKKRGNAYSLSYDQRIMGEFATAKGIELPELAPAERAAWLEERGLHDKFAEFQISQWRERCRTVREAVDEINPKFQFCVYPAPGTPFMREAIWHEWATEEAPLILADASTYGRRSGFLPHAEALGDNRRALMERMETVREVDIPFMYIGGIDPVVRGADPEFSGKNAVMISEVSDGYWIFYEGPTTGQPDHEAYWKWFTWANTAIAEERFEAQHEPRETPDEWGLTTLERKTDKPQIALYGMKPRMFEMIEEAGKLEVHDLRGNSLKYLRQLDVIVLQNFNVALPADSPFSQALR